MPSNNSNNTNSSSTVRTPPRPRRKRTNTDNDSVIVTRNATWINSRGVWAMVFELNCFYFTF